MTSYAKRLVTDLLAQAGVTVNGPKLTDIQVYDESFYGDVFRRGRMGIGEGFMTRKWDVQDLAGAGRFVLRSEVDRTFRSVGALLYFLQAQLTNMQKRSRAPLVARVHYNAGNDLFRHMLGPTMTYSCGYWWPLGVCKLDWAQNAKHDLVCKKLELRKGDHILDLGCGFGEFLRFASEHYGVTGVGVSNSEAHVAVARERGKGLPIEYRLQDWRDIEGTYDHVASIGMFEHVGLKNYESFLRKVASVMRDTESKFLLHSIFAPRPTWIADPWFNEYIFPGGYAPAPSEMLKPAERLPLCPLDGHYFGRGYALTLREWRLNLVTEWPALENVYGPTDGAFFRMMIYYLATMEAAFDVGRLLLYQWMFTKGKTKRFHFPVR